MGFGRHAVRRFVCGGCFSEFVGTWQDLLREGWERHPPRDDVVFLMCGDCEERFEARRVQLAELESLFARPAGVPRLVREH